MLVSHLSFSFSQPVKPAGQLNSRQCLVVEWKRGRDMRNHRCAAGGISDRLLEHACDLTCPV